MLLDDEEHHQVSSLTEITVSRLDESARMLELDMGEASYKYFGRSRMNDQTGNSIRCKIHFNAALMTQSEKDYRLDILNNDKFVFAKIGDFQLPFQM